MNLHLRRPWMNRATPLPSASPRALEPNPRLSREVLLASARFVYENSHRLSPDDSQFAKGMVAVLEAGRTLTPRQRDRLVLLTDSLLAVFLRQSDEC